MDMEDIKALRHEVF